MEIRTYDIFPDLSLEEYRSQIFKTKGQSGVTIVDGNGNSTWVNEDQWRIIAIFFQEKSDDGVKSIPERTFLKALAVATGNAQPFDI